MVKQYSSNWNTVDDVFDSITPNNKYASDYIIAPAGEFKPAAWLPIQWTDVASKDAFVISSGKVVAQDTTGRIVPAGLRKKLLTDNLIYTSTDVKHGVTDLTTGSKVAAAVSYTPLQVAQALVERGLVLETDISAVSAAQVIPKFINHPTGIMQYDVYVWAGDDPASLHFHNYQKQHLVQQITQVQMVVPHMVSSEVADTFAAVALDTAGSETYAAGEFPDAGEYWDAANLSQVNRYSALAATAEVVALGLSKQPVARETDRTPLSCDVEGVLLRRRSGPSELSIEGDYFLDAEVGVLCLHSDTWATLVADAASPEFTFHAYDSVGADAQRYVHLDGRAKPGDKVTFDAESNLVAADLSTVEWFDCVGTLNFFIVEPRGLLGSVKTAWTHQGAGKNIQMPGSATKGFSDLITLSDEVVADQLAVIFIKIS